MTMIRERDGTGRRRLHRAWFVAGVAFVATVGAAGFRATPGVLINPLRQEFGWSVGEISLAVSVNLILYGLTAPFAAALMERFGMRRVVPVALVLVAAGSGLTVGSVPVRWRCRSWRPSPAGGSSGTGAW